MAQSVLKLLALLLILTLTACSVPGAGPSAAPTSGYPVISQKPSAGSTVTPPIAEVSSQKTTTQSTTGFTVTSPDISADGLLPAEYTCDGAASSLALTWAGAPAGTSSFAVIMHHQAGPDDIHWYWVLYNIPPEVTSLPKNMTGIGTLGNNSVNGKTAYAPPCSKGPGPKTYTYTVYALSAQPQLAVPADQVTRAVLLDAIQGSTLASAELNVTYSRP